MTLPNHDYNSMNNNSVHENLNSMSVNEHVTTTTSSTVNNGSSHVTTTTVNHNRNHETTVNTTKSKTKPAMSSGMKNMATARNSPPSAKSGDLMVYNAKTSTFEEKTVVK